MAKYLYAFAIWALIIPLAILNAGFRDHVLATISEDLATPLSGIILSILILLTAILFIPKIRGCTPRDYVGFGLLWFVLTNLLDLVLTWREGGDAETYLKAFDITSGNLWLLVVFTALVAPLIAGRVSASPSRN